MRLCTYQGSLQDGKLLLQLLDLTNITLLANKTLIVLRHVVIARHKFLWRLVQSGVMSRMEKLSSSITSISCRFCWSLRKMSSMRDHMAVDSLGMSPVCRPLVPCLLVWWARAPMGITGEVPLE